jgi:hypothetical protein
VIRNDFRSTGLEVAELRVLVEVAPPGDQLRLQRLCRLLELRLGDLGMRRANGERKQGSGGGCGNAGHGILRGS